MARRVRLRTVIANANAAAVGAQQAVAHADRTLSIADRLLLEIIDGVRIEFSLDEGFDLTSLLRKPVPGERIKLPVNIEIFLDEETEEKVAAATSQMAAPEIVA